MKIKSLFFIFFSFISLLLTGQNDFKNSSILKSGKWYKVKIENSGIYKISYEDLKSIGFNTPENIRIYGRSGKQLSFINEDDIEDDLGEIPLFASKSSGFGPGDYYLFYGEGVESIYYDEENSIYRHKIHNYALSNYYYITSSFGAGKRIEEKNNSSLVSTISQNTYDWVDCHEEEKYNLISTGRQWFGQELKEDSFIKQFVVSNIVANTPILIETSAVVRSGSLKTVKIKANENLISTLEFPSVNIGNHESLYAQLKTGVDSFLSNSEQIDISLSFYGDGLSDEAFLDYITLNARCSLKISSDAFFFRDRKTVGSDAITKFTLSNAVSTTQIWDISNNNKTFRVSKILLESTLSYKSETDTLKEFVAVNVSGSFASPIFIDENLLDVGWIGNQNLHGLSSSELLIISHPAFLVQAEELAQLHRDKDNMSVQVATTTQVYNEFSSGKPDASAIRNIARMFYERSSMQDSLKYLLLFGDGSFDNRTINSINPNYIPTYQSENSLSPTASYVSDDFYAILDEGNMGVNGNLCIGVGRMPVNSDGGDEIEAQIVVDKIKEYYDAKYMSDWRNNMIFLGDDGEHGWDATVFMTDSDKLTEIVEREAPAMNFNKIFLDAYQQISSSIGASYPDVEDALDEAFKKGALVFNYMGHGGENGITQEHVLTSSDFQNMTNAPYYPLFITATCQLSRYDNVEINGAQWSKRVSAGEVALLNPIGGAIAMLTTTRLVYQSSNRKLSETLYQNLFRKDYKGDRYRLGDIIRIAKNKTTASRNNTLKFTLLGDPAITLAYGEYKIITDSINSRAVNELPDTLKALNEVSISGYVAYYDSTIINDFKGVVYVNTFDKEYMVTSNGNDNTETIDFSMQDKLLYRGKASVTDGRFNVVFMVPKDISYSFGKGKLSFYAENGIIDAKGYYEEFIIGGTALSPEVDMDGPEIALFMNNKSFIDGGVTDPNPILVAEVYDTNGINTTGNGIGHNLVGILDEDLSRSYLMNDYFIGELDNYRKGLLQYPLIELEDGYHSIAVKVWDTYNNSSEETINFYVDNSGNLVMNELLNYPNPAKTYTTFQYSHNSPGTEHTVRINIFDITGRVIHQIIQTNSEDGYVSEPITWNFTSGNGTYFEPGVYPYRISVTTSEGNDGSQSGSLIIIP